MNEYYLVDIDPPRRVRTVIRKRFYHSIVGMPFLTVDYCRASGAKAAVNLFTARHGFGYVII